MTSQMIIEEVFRRTGKPSNLQIYTNPSNETTFDITLPGSVRLLRYVNTAITRIANWRFRDGSIMRLRNLYSRMFFNVLDPRSEAVLLGGTSVIEVAGFITNVAGQFDGWVAEVSAGAGVGQVRLVTSSVLGGAGVQLTLNEAFSTALDLTSVVKLYKAFFDMVPNTGAYPYLAYHIGLDPTIQVSDIMKIRDTKQFQDLIPVNADEVFTTSMLQSGIPTQYRIYGNQVWFDVPMAEAGSFEILYMKNPTDMTAATDVPQVPVIYHEAAILWATHSVMMLYQDFDGAYATKKELEDLMNQLRLQGSFELSFESTGLTVWG